MSLYANFPMIIIVFMLLLHIVVDFSDFEHIKNLNIGILYGRYPGKKRKILLFQFMFLDMSALLEIK